MKTKINISGIALTLTSPHTMEELKKVIKFKPEACKLKDEEGETYFVMLPSSHQCLDESTVAYAHVGASGKACLSVLLPDAPADKLKSYVTENFGPIIAKMNKVEEQIDAALAEVNEMLDGIASNITVDDGETCEAACEAE